MKNIKYIFLLIIGIVMVTVACSSSNTDENESTFIIENNLEDIFDLGIRPQVQLLQNEAANFSLLVNAFNEDSTEENFNALRASWESLTLTWKPLEAITIGDFALTSRIVAIHFWPIAVESLQANIENFTESDFTLSARARGLGALEYILFANEFEVFINNENAANSIAYLNVITDQLLLDINSYDQAWLDYETEFKSGTESSVTGTQNELINEVIFTFFDIIVTKIQGTILSNEEGASPLNSETPYSELSLDIIEVQISFIQRLFAGDFLEGIDTVSIYDQINELNRADLVENLDSQFDLVLSSLSVQENSLESLVVNNPEIIQTIEDNITALNVLISNDVVSVLDVLITVSDNDGD